MRRRKLIYAGARRFRAMQKRRARVYRAVTTTQKRRARVYRAVTTMQKRRARVYRAVTTPGNTYGLAR